MICCCRILETPGLPEHPHLPPLRLQGTPCRRPRSSERSVRPPLEVNVEKEYRAYRVSKCTYLSGISNSVCVCVPFSVCSIICLMAFFKLLALSISCSLGLKIAAVGRGEQGGGTESLSMGVVWEKCKSPSSCSSAMVGVGMGVGVGLTTEA